MALSGPPVNSTSPSRQKKASWSIVKKSILKDSSTFFKDNLSRKPCNRYLYQTSVSYKAQTVKTFLEYCYNNNVSAAPPELWQMSLELGVKSLILYLVQCFNKSPNDVEILRQAERRTSKSTCG